MSGQPPPAPPTTSSGLEPNLAAALAYLPILAIIWLLVDPYSKDRFIKFHSIQSIALAVVSIGVTIILAAIPVFGWILLPFLQLGVFIVAVICAVKAYQKETFKLPVLGDFAEKQIAA
jgi:uncharacterized membrane protein